ncbi:unnamed protein product [Adineta steineri]|uniref:Uncharacterized protein n=1 Tax=Adineta steineri TaxID=433720 RepID=A0A814WIF9_9BILA|nr:unnamed protein product [Adineta steineri]CAF1201958.1 unnamed protein product [Adineta steineri]
MVVSIGGAESKIPISVVDHFANNKMKARRMSYDECFCNISSNCTSQANLVDKYLNQNISVRGLKIGCLSSESFLQSTLECFYDLNCIQLIQNYTNYEYNNNSKNSFIPFSSTNMTKILINTTISQLIDELFVDDWNITLNYSSYYRQCSPIDCSYSYIQKLNSIHTLQLLIGFQGGLTIILQ